VGDAGPPFSSRRGRLIWLLAAGAAGAAILAARDYFGTGATKSSTGSERATSAPPSS